MEKRSFKLRFNALLKKEVIGLSSEEKIKYMKKWIQDYQQSIDEPVKTLNTNETVKVGLLVRTTMREIVRDGLLSHEKVQLLQDERYCKNTFDINYPFLKKVVWKFPLSDQRKINGYDRYWAEEVTIDSEKFLICNDWYERNKPKFLKWVKELN